MSEPRPGRKRARLDHHRFAAARAVCTAALLFALSGAARAQEPSQSVLDGVYTEAQAARGAEQYAQSCAVCHGISLGGQGEAPGLIGGQFIADFDGLTVGDLYDRVRTTMPLTAPSSLSRTQYADILAFVFKSNGYPAGSRELDHRSEFLAEIRFQSPSTAPAPAPPPTPAPAK